MTAKVYKSKLTNQWAAVGITFVSGRWFVEWFDTWEEAMQCANEKMSRR